MTNQESLAVLKKRRAVIQASCTRIKTFVESISTVTSQTIAQLEKRKVKLDGFWSDYEDVQMRLELIDDAESSHRPGFEEAYYSLAAKMREILNPARSIRTSSLSPAPSNASDSFTHLRLPKLNLPTFSGQYQDWYPFFDTFQAVIHSNMSISDIQKLQYLKTSLTDDAAKVIGSLEVSALNYEVAWSLLKERYDNRRVIVQNHIKAILDLPAMARENVVELRQIADGAARHIQALQALKRPTSYWDDLLVHILSAKLDPQTRREWQTSLTTTDLPTFKQLRDFITHQCQVLEAAGKSTNIHINTRSQTKIKKQTVCNATIKLKCIYCKSDHIIYRCKDFLALTVQQRGAEIRKRKACFNCLRSVEHNAAECSSGACKLCSAKHNTLLHVSGSAMTPRVENKDDSERATSTASSSIVAAHSSSTFATRDVMLSTAVVHAHDVDGSRVSCRVLLDSGSQANFISEKFMKTLRLTPRAINVSVRGINNSAIQASQLVSVRLQSRVNSFSAVIECIVSKRITDDLPSIKMGDLVLPRNIKLADSRIDRSSDIDVLIGADLFWRLLCMGQIKASLTHPTLQKTLFGWVVAGRLENASNLPRDVRAFHASVTDNSLSEQLYQFWKLEDIPDKSENYTFEEKQCEQHFLKNVSRNHQGRYTVSLPFKEPIANLLGNSKAIALKRLIGLERRFKRDPNLKDKYVQFLNEYLELGHMKLIDNQSIDDSDSYYLPHHCVFKGGSRSSKARVVFDASSKSSNGKSLNDVLFVGPVVQQDLVDILIRFRTFRYVLVADIIKMYRQVLINPSQTRYQRILWREHPDSNIGIYELNTITYGTSSASYLATRCLKHLAETNSATYPLGFVVVSRDFYVDDMLTGADSINDAETKRDETVQLLRNGGFELSKWASNRPELIRNLVRQESSAVSIDSGTDYRVLGVNWDQSLDSFHFSYHPSEIRDVASKRVILSEISSLFDPLGLLGPVIIVAKLIMQDIWQLGIHWDESVPQAVYHRWMELKNQLKDIDRISIPRRVKFATKPDLVQIHGFCDASQRAYGACVYIRSKLGESEYRTELLCSKSRVAPLKAVTLPRLELSAALLLARLIAKIKASIDTIASRTFLWSDSMITLSWISSPSRKWTVFVANRVGEIQRLTEISSWRHISSKLNPADILSRGLDPFPLASATTWWHGPPFLNSSDNQWLDYKPTHMCDSPPEQKVLAVTATVKNSCLATILLSNHSNLNKACRILAYCFRFCNARHLRAPSLFVSHDEIQYALRAFCKSAQRQAFPIEYNALCKSTELDKSSKIISLSPFLHSDGLIRVGGRLKNANLDFEASHPILLPRNHVLTTRVIEQEHIRSVHAGVQATMSTIRQRFWPLSLRSAVRKVVRRCITCFKVKPALSQAKMGSLPSGRVSVSRPLFHTCVDYAGPFLLRESKRRNARLHKAYSAIFVCFATKAIHIELVSDLTSEAFIASLKRFISRRGKPAHLYSDNGTTFVGAHKQLKELQDLLNREQTRNEIKHFLCEQETTWSFIPPYAPHFGGLWEAAVKSVKHHLYRVAGKAHLTYEELQTILCDIEAVLNSRPITPLSEDANDLSFLTPGHFLVGTIMNGFPSIDLSDVKENRLIRWQRIEQMRQHFWRRWSVEYLHSLQERTKWKFSKGEPLKIGQLVLVIQPGLPPLQWLSGRIEAVHVGSDGVARTATVKTSRGSLVRPLTKISVLPLET